MPRTAHDRSMVAAKDDHESEVKFIAHKYHVPIGVVRTTMLECGKNGKPCRSRKVNYAGLRAKGYPIPTKYEYKGKDRLPEFDGEVDGIKEPVRVAKPLPGNIKGDRIK